MQVLAAAVGLVLVAIVLRDTFETIILPRRVAGVRLSKVFYQVTWRPWSAIGRRLHGDRRENVLSTYGPISLLLLILLWGTILVTGFGLLLWAAGFDANLSGPDHLYVSGTTFTTYTSSDGVTWTQVTGSSVTLASLSGPALAGMAVTSHNANVPGTVTFDTVSVGTTIP